jgi:hypothetical protein
MEAVPSIKPGHENDKFLTEFEVLQISKHFSDQQVLELRANALKAAKETLTLKMQMCDLSKSNLQAQIADLSRSDAELERARQNLHQQYENGVRAAIKTKYNLPKDKNFGFDPATFKLTITD